MKLRRLVFVGVLLVSAAALFAQEKLNWYVCTGSYGVEDNAIRFKGELEKSGYTAFIEPATSKDGKRLYRVCLDEYFEDVDGARSLRDKFSASEFASKKGLTGIWICNAPEYDKTIVKYESPKVVENLSAETSATETASSAETGKSAAPVVVAVPAPADMAGSFDENVLACLEKTPYTKTLSFYAVGFFSLDNIFKKVDFENTYSGMLDVDILNATIDEDDYENILDATAVSVVAFADEATEKAIALTAIRMKDGNLKGQVYEENATYSSSDFNESVLAQDKVREMLSAMPKVAADDFFYFTLARNETDSVEMWQSEYCFAKEKSVIGLKIFDLGTELERAKEMFATAAEKSENTVKVKDSAGLFIREENAITFFSGKYMIMLNGFDTTSTVESLTAIAEEMNIW